VKKVLFTAAHSGFSLNQVPLGGGAAVCEQLVREWGRTRPFELKVLGPSVLGPIAPKDKDLVHYSELAYARFCKDFERVLTGTILEEDPKSTVVLSNDVSEGPDFKRLGARGYPVYTIYHVDVVDYFTTIYLRGRLSPERTTSIYRQIMRWGLSGLVPSILKLVWDKQEASVRYSRGLIVPSRRMKEVLLECYPETSPRKIHVLPWGTWGNPVTTDDLRREKAFLENHYPVLPNSWVLMTLSRLSPEKGQDRLLQALAQWETRKDFPKEGICLYIAGEGAFMMGKKFEQRLRHLAARLKRCRVHFIGHVTGARKKALFQMADLYVFPSRHESYGLTLLEALREGKPVLAMPSHGAEEVFKPEFGAMVPPGPEASAPDRLREALQRLLVDRSTLRRMGETAAAWAAGQDFSVTASRLAELVASQ